MSNAANTGHGHVYKRPDGAKARCGGPGLCSECSRDLAQKMREDARNNLPAIEAKDFRQDG
jgi:hypothetical protein